MRGPGSLALRLSDCFSVSCHAPQADSTVQQLPSPVSCLSGSNCEASRHKTLSESQGQAWTLAFSGAPCHRRDQTQLHPYPGGLSSLTCPVQVDISDLSTYQPRFEPPVQPLTSHISRGKAGGSHTSPTSHTSRKASLQELPSRLWTAHKQPAGCYQWLGDRFKAVLLVLAILGLIFQAFTLQPHQGPGVSPFAPRHAKQAQQPLLSQVGLDSIGDYTCRRMNLRSAVQSAYVMCQGLACRLTIGCSPTLQSGS